MYKKFILVIFILVLLTNSVFAFDIFKDIFGYSSKEDFVSKDVQSIYKYYETKVPNNENIIISKYPEHTNTSINIYENSMEIPKKKVFSYSYDSYNNGEEKWNIDYKKSDFKINGYKHKTRDDDIDLYINTYSKYDLKDIYLKRENTKSTDYILVRDNFKNLIYYDSKGNIVKNKYIGTKYDKDRYKRTIYSNTDSSSDFYKLYNGYIENTYITPDKVIESKEIKNKNLIFVDKLRNNPNYIITGGKKIEKAFEEKNGQMYRWINIKTKDGYSYNLATYNGSDIDFAYVTGPNNLFIDLNPKYASEKDPTYCNNSKNKGIYNSLDFNLDDLKIILDNYTNKGDIIAVYNN